VTSCVLGARVVIKLTAIIAGLNRQCSKATEMRAILLAMGFGFSITVSTLFCQLGLASLDEKNRKAFGTPADDVILGSKNLAMCRRFAAFQTTPVRRASHHQATGRACRLLLFPTPKSSNVGH